MFTRAAEIWNDTSYNMDPYKANEADFAGRKLAGYKRNPETGEMEAIYTKSDSDKLNEQLQQDLAGIRNQQVDQLDPNIAQTQTGYLADGLRRNVAQTQATGYDASLGNANAQSTNMQAVGLTNEQADWRARQVALADQLTTAAGGGGPSIADATFARNRDAALAATAAAAASQRGGANVGLAQRQLTNASAAAQLDNASQQAIAKAGEQLSARDNLANLLTNARSGDYSFSAANAGFQNAAAQQNASAANQFALANQQATFQNAAAQNASKQFYANARNDANNINANAQNAANNTAFNAQSNAVNTGQSVRNINNANNIAQQRYQNEYQFNTRTMQNSMNQADRSAMIDYNKLQSNNYNTAQTINADSYNKMKQRQHEAYGAIDDTENQIAGGIFKAGLSDKTTKKDVKSLDDDFLSKLEAYAYKYKDEYAGSDLAPSGENYGVMAQDLEKTSIGSKAVKEVGKKKVVDYSKLASALLAGEVVLNKKLNVLEDALAELKKKKR